MSGSEARRRAAPPATGSVAAILSRERLESPNCRGLYMHVSFQICIAQGTARTAQQKGAHGRAESLRSSFGSVPLYRKGQLNQVGAPPDGKRLKSCLARC